MFKSPGWHSMLLTCGSIVLMGCFASCISQRKTNYFNNIKPDPTIQLPPIKADDRIIEKGDDISISFEGGDVEAVKPFNKLTSLTASAPSPTGPAPTVGYVVTSDGYIELPVLGKLKVAGFTSTMLKNKLEEITSPYIKNPVVDVKFNSFKVTLLGEVRAPGTYNLGLQNTTILDALAAAGDLPLTARKYNLQLYRDYNGVRSMSKINLTDGNLLTDKNFFYLKPNDVIYVKTRRSSIFTEDFGVFSAITTLIVSIVTLGITVTNN